MFIARRDNRTLKYNILINLINLILLKEDTIFKYMINLIEYNFPPR